MADFTPEEVIQFVEAGRKCMGADLRDINLSGAKLNGADLSGAWYDVGTKWPEGFDPEFPGPRLVD